MFNSKAKYLRYINIIGILERYIERNTREKINEHFFRSISHYYPISHYYYVYARELERGKSVES